MSATETKNSLLLDPKLWNFFEQLISGKIQEVTPNYYSSNAFGCRYPEVEKLLEMDTTETISTLNILYSAGILEREFFNNVFKCPKCGSIHVHYYQACDNCGSNEVTAVKVVEHLTCGYIGPSNGIIQKSDVKYCPECNGELREAKVDYLISDALICQSCETITPDLEPQFLCFDCQGIVPKSELVRQEIYKYRLNMDMRGDLVKVLSYRPILPREIPSRKRQRKQDRLDMRILNIMQMDARTSFREIARRTGVSDATVRDRVNKMIEKGWIEGFVTIVNPSKLGKNVTCLMNIKVDPQDFKNIIANLENLREIKMIFELTEKNLLIILVVLDDKEQLRQFINDTIYQIPGIEIDKVSNVINIAKNDPRLYLS
ncbi:MAG: winged helix-turn-helix transcriptional regulator [Candidatus Helarchaeota archaeon]